jgi:hypothetical protein
MGCKTNLHRLSCDRINRTRCANLKFVENHVSQSLIVDYANVDVGRKFLPSDTGVHRLIAIIVVPSGKKLLPKVIDGCVFFRKSCRKSVQVRNPESSRSHLNGVAS